VRRSGIVTLTTDFGWRDFYVAAMKGVILSIFPGAVLVDVSHDVPPGDVREAALLLAQAAPCFPPGTVHAAVVDPGVGTGRRAFAAEAGGQLLVGPDNGLFWPLLARDPERRVVHLTETGFFRPTVSRTFHGRDLFAPVAAHLASGRDPEEMGRPVDDPVVLEEERAREEDGVLVGEVTRVDRFGNLVTNMDLDLLERFLGGRNPRIEAGRLEVTGIRGCYGDVEPGEALALIGSTGHLELSVNGGRASERAAPSGEPLSGTQVRVRAGS
jgi:hypothetical protein